MNKLLLLLREYQDCRWYCQKNEQRFLFDTNGDRALFVHRLDEVGAVYHLYESPSTYKVDVYTDGKNPYESEQD
jgi:hypothetical protein